MPLPLLLDSNILGKVVHPERGDEPITVTIGGLLNDPRFRILVPEIADYELRRKLLHLSQHPHHGRKWARESIHLLDRLVARGYVELTTKAMRLAAKLWAETRIRGQSRDEERGLDVDVILAAQAYEKEAYIVTTNEKHFRGLAPLFDWRPYQP